MGKTTKLRSHDKTHHKGKKPVRQEQDGLLRLPFCLIYTDSKAATNE